MLFDIKKAPMWCFLKNIVYSLSFYSINPIIDRMTDSTTYAALLYAILPYKSRAFYKILYFFGLKINAITTDSKIVNAIPEDVLS